MIDLRQLATFRAAVEQRTFVEAAKTLHYSQSTVTVQVKQLEAELGTPLFTRIGKRATLNEAGRALYQHALPLGQHRHRRVVHGAARLLQPREIGRAPLRTP